MWSRLHYLSNRLEALLVQRSLNSRLAGSPLFTQTHFSKILEKHMPRSLRDHLRDLFLRLELVLMNVWEYKAQFHELYRYVISILTTAYERVHCIILGLRLLLCIST